MIIFLVATLITLISKTFCFENFSKEIFFNEKFYIEKNIKEKFFSLFLKNEEGGETEKNTVSWDFYIELCEYFRKRARLYRSHKF